MSEQKRKTVNVLNGSGRALMLHLHQNIADDGAGRAFQGRALASFSKDIPDAVSLKPGHNAGIDKEFLDAWLSQNKAFAEQAKVTAQDEDNPETESAEREEHD